MKRLDKLGAALLTACVICSMSLTVFAADTGLGPDSTSGDTNITANASIPGEPAYTVTIPPTIPVGNLTKTAATSVKSTTFKVSAADVADLGNKKVTVSISTADGSFNLTDGNGHTLPYQVFKEESGGTALASGDLFTTFTADSSNTGRVDIDQADIEAAGSYTGTLTFTIELKDGGGVPDFGGDSAF